MSTTRRCSIISACFKEIGTSLHDCLYFLQYSSNEPLSSSFQPLPLTCTDETDISRKIHIIECGGNINYIKSVCNLCMKNDIIYIIATQEGYENIEDTERTLLGNIKHSIHILGTGKEINIDPFIRNTSPAPGAKKLMKRRSSTIKFDFETTSLNVFASYLSAKCDNIIQEHKSWITTNIEDASNIAKTKATIIIWANNINSYANFLERFRNEMFACYINMSLDYHSSSMVHDMWIEDYKYFLHSNPHFVREKVNEWNEIYENIYVISIRKQNVENSPSFTWIKNRLVNSGYLIDTHGKLYIK
jgi:hypothetical protein